MLVEAIATARALPPERVRMLIDQAPFRADAACEVGLIDGALYEDELEPFLTRLMSDHTRTGSSALAAQQPDTVSLVDWRQADRWLPLPKARRERRVVGVVPVIGAIAQGRAVARRCPSPCWEACWPAATVSFRPSGAPSATVVSLRS